MSFRKIKDNPNEDTMLVTIVDTDDNESMILTKEEMRVLLSGLQVLPSLVTELKKMNVQLEAMTGDNVADTDILGG